MSLPEQSLVVSRQYLVKIQRLPSFRHCEEPLLFVIASLPKAGAAISYSAARINTVMSE